MIKLLTLLNEVQISVFIQWATLFYCLLCLLFLECIIFSQLFSFKGTSGMTEKLVFLLQCRVKSIYKFVHHLVSQSAPHVPA